MIKMFADSQLWNLNLHCTFMGHWILAAAILLCCGSHNSASWLHVLFL